MNRRSLRTRTDVDRLKAWLAEDPVRNWAAILAKGVKAKTMEAILADPNRAPQTLTKRAICEASGKAESWFFPLVTSEGKKIA